MKAICGYVHTLKVANFRLDEKFEWPLSSHGSGQHFGAVHCRTVIGAVHTELWNPDIFKQSEYEHDS